MVSEAERWRTDVVDKSPRAALGTKSDRPKERGKKKKTFCLAAKPLTFKLTTERRVDRLNDLLCSSCSHLPSTLTFPPAAPSGNPSWSIESQTAIRFHTGAVGRRLLPGGGRGARLLLKRQTSFFCFFVFFPFQQLISCLSSRRLNVKGKLRETQSLASLSPLPSPPTPSEKPHLVQRPGH